MCGRYGFSASDEYLTSRFDLEAWDFELRESWNVAPTHEEPVVERHSPNSLHLRQWGVMPSWSPKLMINAQSEKLALSNFWKKAFAESRCIVPVSWFYEWKKLPDGKQPYLFRFKNKEMMGLAGLLISVRDKTGQPQKGFVVITVPANKLMEPVHNRMPAILRKEDEDEWLNPDNVEPEKLLPLLAPYADDEMEAFPISSQVNSPKNNHSGIINSL